MPRIYVRQVRTRGLRPDWSQVIKEVEKELDKTVKPLFLGYFYRIVARWSHPVEFRAKKFITKEWISIYVYPTGPFAWLWKLVSVTGAKRHDIEIKVAEWLKFIWGGYGSYQAKTTTSGGYKGPGVPQGTWRKMKLGDHPGFGPRNFEKHIARWGTPKARKLIDAAFRRGIRKAKANAKR